MIPVAVFAHNEARGILRCLRSFAAGAPGMDLRLYVLCNGNTDGTNDIVAAYARDNPQISLIDIALGDKANAWNVHVHEVAPQADAYVFMDGDCELLADAVPRMLWTLRTSPAANAVSALPASGRTVRHWRRQIVEQHALVGGLYALSGSFVARIRAGKLRLPTGFVGDDSLLGSLAAWDLDPRGDWDAITRVAICTDAEFRCDSMSYCSFDDLRRQMRRMARYSRRRYEMQMINDLLRSAGLAGMPSDTGELYRSRGRLCRLAWRGMWTPFDWLALRKIRQRAAFPRADRQSAF
jgi:glycosyltransferase involved in cell wall biosynthesis